jgi:hypothetical protein
MPLGLGAGGTWRLDGGDSKPFPQVSPADAHLFRGTGSTLVVRDPNGIGLRFTVPPDTYQELTDRRPWGTLAYAWATWLKLFNGAGNPGPTCKIEQAGPAR